jgi:hypothetical protein
MVGNQDMLDDNLLLAKLVVRLTIEHHPPYRGEDVTRKA